MRLEFFMPMLPPTTTHQQQQIKIVYKNGEPKPLFYDPPDLKAARVKLLGHLAKHVPEKKYTCGVRLITKWLFPITGKRKDGQYKTTKPDTDNLIKLFKDCATELKYWTDDALVVSEVTEKFWAENPGIYVCIESLEGR